MIRSFCKEKVQTAVHLQAAKRQSDLNAAMHV